MALFAADVDGDYWGTRLEVDTEPILRQYADEGSLEAWVAGLSPPCRAILSEQLAMARELSNEQTSQALRERRDALLPFLLASAAAAGKRSCIIVEVAGAKLSSHELAACRVEPDGSRFDRRALLWRLYLADPENLELVVHLDRLQRQGLTRMVLDRFPGAPARAVDAFFTQPALQSIVKRGEHGSHCAAVLCQQGTYLVLLRRDIARCAREWILLEFERDLLRVRIGALSPDVPLLLANRIASAWFGTAVAYDSERPTTAASEVVAFLQSLLAHPDRLPLVELIVKNCGLDGAPQLRLNDQENESLAPAVHQLAALLSNPFAVIHDIESIKVYAFQKRVRMRFERAAEDGTRFLVRYTDQVLGPSERRAFERMMEREHGIQVLSTETRHAC